ncbi:MAG: hypothetical protein KDC12_04170, partial [Flavobacteriales bacterium]|nr:hypothetical protein [Flavobacteriales bacterium]
MRVLFTLCALWLGTALYAQEVFWTEDFGTGCNQGQVVSSYSGTNGAWTLANSGSNQTASNTFYVSAMENGNAPGECGSSCGNDRSLHVGNVFIDAILIQIPADQGASYYDSGAAGLCGFIDCSTTDKRAQSPVIDCTGYENIEVTFSYLEGGNGITDNAVLQYNTGSGWLVLQDLPKTTCCGGPCNGTNQGLWSELTVTLPEEAADNPNVQLGIRWVNNDDGVGTDPSFAIDDISLSGTP